MTGRGHGKRGAQRQRTTRVACTWSGGQRAKPREVERSNGEVKFAFFGILQSVDTPVGQKLTLVGVPKAVAC